MDETTLDHEELLAWLGCDLRTDAERADRTLSDLESALTRDVERFFAERAVDPGHVIAVAGVTVDWPGDGADRPVFGGRFGPDGWQPAAWLHVTGGGTSTYAVTVVESTGGPVHRADGEQEPLAELGGGDGELGRALWDVVVRFRREHGADVAHLRAHAIAGRATSAARWATELLRTVRVGTLEVAALRLDAAGEPGQAAAYRALAADHAGTPAELGDVVDRLRARD